MKERIFIGEEHHEVLKFWQKFKGLEIKTLTLDHHIDSLPMFSFYKQNHPNWEEPNSLSLSDALKLLRHDEHIDYAINHNFISKSVIIAHALNENSICNPKIQVVSDNRIDRNLPVNSPELREYFDMAIEDNFLARMLPKDFFLEPYILDIDLDYFKTFKSINPKESNIFRTLCKNAQGISISLESIWVKLLSFEDSSFTSQEILNNLSKNYFVDLG